MKSADDQSAYRRRERRLAFLFVLPSLAVFILFMFYPLLYTLYLSFFKWNMVSPKMKFVALDNYVNLLTDPVTVTIAEIRCSISSFWCCSISFCPMYWPL